MSSGITREINGTITLSAPYEMTSFDDILNIIGATISLTVPGDIFTNEGADTVTISDSTFSGEEACGIYLGSGNDSLELKNSTIGIKLFTGSGSDFVAIKGNSQSSVVIGRQFSLGDGDDLLEIASTLTINAVMDFGNGSDTLKFNGGKLVFSASLSGLENLCVTASGGTLGNDLSFTGENSTIELNGNLNGTSNQRKLLWDNASIILQTGSNIVTNIAWSIINSSLSHLDGGSLKFTGTSGYGMYAENSTISLHDVLFSGGIYGIRHNGGSITLTKASFSNHTQALNIKNAELTGADVSFSGNSVGIYTNADLNLVSARFISNGNAISQNSGNATINSGVFSNNSSGAIIHSGGTMQLVGGCYNSNIGSKYKSCSPEISTCTTTYPRSRVTSYVYKTDIATASGGVILQNGGMLIVTDISLAKNQAIAEAIAKSTEYSSTFIDRMIDTRYSFNFVSETSSIYYQTYYLYETHAVSILQRASACAFGGGGCKIGGDCIIQNATFSKNTATARISRQSTNDFASAFAAGGGFYFSGRQLNATSAFFAGNMASRDTTVHGRAAGGAIYIKADICNINDTAFTDNSAYDYGGAIYVDASPITFSVFDDLKLSNTGNQAAHGGFLYNSNGSIAFDIGNKAVLTVGKNDANTDSIAGSGTISKTGSGLFQIYSDISEYTGMWIVSEGEVWLRSRARNINLSNWTIGGNATLTLSEYNDVLTMGADKIIGTIDFGGGSDTINTGGYHLLGGKLLVSSITLTGGGSVSSDIFVRESGTGFDITLNDVILNSNITGGNAIDKVVISQQSTFGGSINLGDGNNIIIATAGVVFEKALASGSGDDTFTFTDATFKDKVILSGNGEIPVNGEPTQEKNDITASGTVTFEEDVYTGNGFDTLSFQDVTFKKKLDLGAQENSFTATGIATFGGNLISYDGNDTFRFRDAIIDGVFNLGSGNNTVTATGVFVSDGALSGGSGNDTITLKNASTINGEIALGGGRNYIYVNKSLTVGDGFKLDASGETHLVVYNGAQLGENSLTLFEQAGETLTSVAMNWSAIPDLDTVRIVVSSDHTFKNFEFTVELYNQTKAFSIDLPDHYFIQFQAHDEDGWKQRLLTDTVAPDQVTGLVFTGKKLVWDATHDNLGGNGVKQYTVQVAADAAFNTVITTDTTTETEYDLSSVGSGNYYFRVRAEDYTNNTGAWSETVSGELDLIAPSRPGGGSSSVNGYDVTLSWNASTDTGVCIVGYEYRIASDSSFETVLRTGTTEALTVGENALAYGTYYWQVRAFDGAENYSDWSLSKNFKTVDTVAPTVPGNPDYAVEERSITVSWDASADDELGSGLKGYIVQIAGDAAFSQIVKTVSVSGTEAEIAGLADGDYYMRIGVADNAGNQSAWTETLTFTIDGSAPGPEPAVGGIAGDLNADGRADIVMTIAQDGHAADGSTGAWLILEDQTAAWGDLSTRNPGWDIFGTGRTSADKATADVYIKSSDNVVGAWTTGDDGKVNGWETIGEFSSETQIVGLGDFNGNGQTDLLLRNTNGAVGCFFTGGEKTGWNYFQSLGDEWKLSAVGDLNGDGRDDVVLKHDAGFAGSWLTQADGTMAWADLDTLPDGFEIVGAGDFDGDGTDDVLLKNGNYYGAWLVNNGNAAGWMGLGDLGSVTVEQIADFNGDGVDDLRIRTSAGDLGTQLVMGEDNLVWKYYGSVGEEWKTGLAALS